MAEGIPVLVVFEVWSPPPPADFRIIITGSHDQLGNWFTARPVSMELQGEGVWKLEVTLSSLDVVEYKYACYSAKQGRCVGYEQGHNRQLVVAQLLNESSDVDDASGLRKINLKDVWSSVSNANAATPGVTPGVGGGQQGGMYNNYAQHQAQPMGMPPQQQAYMGQQHMYPQPGYAPHGQYGYGQQPGGNYGMQSAGRPMSQNLTTDSAINFLQQQLQERGVAGDPSLEDRLERVVGEVSGLKKKLKDSQRMEKELQMHEKDMIESAKGVEARFESKLMEARAQLAEMEQDLARAKVEADAIANRGGAPGAGVKEELTAAQEKHQAVVEKLEMEIAKLQNEVDETKNKLEEVKSHQQVTESSHSDATRQLEAVEGQMKEKDKELGAISSAIQGFGEKVASSKARSRILDSSAPLNNRITTLVEYLEKEATKTDGSIFAGLRGDVNNMRKAFAEQKRGIQADMRAEVALAMKLLQSRLQPFVEEKEKEIEVYLERYQKQYDERRRLANEIVDLKGKIRVFGRARPFNKRESENGHANVLAFPENNRLLIGSDAEKFMMINDVDEGVDTQVGQHDIENVKTYELDHIFPPTSTQTEVFEEIKHLIGSTLDGYNVTVFAYGQTGSGKTHTMDGPTEDPGITIRSLGLFFDMKAGSNGMVRRVSRSNSGLMKRPGSTPVSVAVEISMLEIYNEEIRDLLVADSESSTKLDVRQTPDGGSMVPGLTRRTASSLAEAMSIMDDGRENRKTSSTKMNATSSRSHMVFTAYVTTTNTLNKNQTSSKLHLVDLAGSERVSKTGASGEQLKEAMSINKSLSALGDVIASLTATGNTGHVPYRNSKLTFLLQDSLCGNSRTAMFVALSPSSDNYWETISTLNFGARAASVELGQVQKNFESGEGSILRNQIAKLTEQLNNQKSAAGEVGNEVSTLQDTVSTLRKEKESLEKKFKLIQRQLDDAQANKGSAESASNKKIERLRQDLKDKDATIAELQQTVKKSKKDAMEGQKGQAGEKEVLSRELKDAKKQLEEAQKKAKQLETKVSNSETKLRKVEAKVAKAEEAAASAREAEKKSKNASKSEIESLKKQLAEAEKKALRVGRLPKTPRSSSPMNGGQRSYRATNSQSSIDGDGDSENNGGSGYLVKPRMSIERNRITKSPRLVSSHHRRKGSGDSRKGSSGSGDSTTSKALSIREIRQGKRPN